MPRITWFGLVVAVLSLSACRPGADRSAPTAAYSPPVTTPPVTAPTAGPLPELVEHPVRYVDPFIGTRNRGNTYPGPVMPFGMIALGPETTRGDTRFAAAPGGYQYDANRIRGFSLARLSGTGCRGASGDVPFFPFTGSVDRSPVDDAHDEVYATSFDHEREHASPGYYEVRLDDGIGVQLAVTERSGQARFAFPSNRAAKLLVRTSHGQIGSGDATTTIDAESATITGSVTSGNFCGYLDPVNRRDYYTLHFVAQFDAPFVETGAWTNGRVRAGATRSRGGSGYGKSGVPPVGKGSGVWVGFDAARHPVVTMRVGISYVSLANAKANLVAEQRPDDTIETLSQRTAKAWDRELSRIRIAERDTDRLTVFYTALYHSLIHPNLFSDQNGEYMGFDNRPHQVAPGQAAQYANFSGWDVYRSQLQLVAWLDPKRASDMAQSLLHQANHNDGIWDRWTHNNGATSVMSGDPAAIAIANFVAFGADAFDVTSAYASLARAARVPTALDLDDEGCPVSCRGQRPSLDQWLELGYISRKSNAWAGAAETLEQASADFALSQLAARLELADDHREFLARAGNWRHLFNPRATIRHGYVQDRERDGSWRPGFAPATEDGFVEGSAAQYLWMVPFDGQGLFDALGGNDTAVARLDAFFHHEDGRLALTRAGPLHADLSNQPSIGAPWMYAFAGVPARTQAIVGATLDELWHATPDGIPGNDDLGQMSSWYVWSALGLYPLYPGRGDLVITSPRFERAVVQRNVGSVEITTSRRGETARFVESLQLEGQPWTRSYVPESALSGPMRLEFVLSDHAKSSFGTRPEDVPPSFGVRP